MNILHIDTSIQGADSASRQISADAIERLLFQHPDAAIVRRDLVKTPLPHLTLDGFSTADSQEALAEFLDADIVVIGTGMYNFTVPTQLKGWLDRIVVAGRTFRYTDVGPEGLAGDKRVIVALARGGQYGASSPAAGLEHAETYLRGLFAFLGVERLEIIVADGLAIPELRHDAIQNARHAASRLAA